jgi:hypothetical protein
LYCLQALALDGRFILDDLPMVQVVIDFKMAMRNASLPGIY